MNNNATPGDWKLVTDPIEKAKSLNSYYASLISCERNNPQIQSTESCKPFTISVNVIKKILTIGEKESVGRDGIPGEFKNYSEKT